MLAVLFPNFQSNIAFIIIVISGLTLAISLLFVQSFSKKNVEKPLEMMVNTAHHVIGGLPSDRVHVQDMYFSEFKRTAEAINVLADKASKDIAELKKLEQVRSNFWAMYPMN